MKKYGIFNQPATQSKPTVKNENNSGPKMGMGDYYGTGVKNNIGRLRDSTVGYRPVSREQMGTPPKSLA